MRLKRGAYVFAITAVNGLLLVLPFSFLRILLLRISGMRIGKLTHLQRGIRVDFPWRLTVGDRCHLSSGVYLDGRGGNVRIGNCVDISGEALIFSLTHDIRDESFSPKKGEVRIEDRTWIGTRAIVLPGTTVAEGCVVGAASVVRGTTEPYSLYVGVPAIWVKRLPESRASRVRQGR